MTIDWKKLESDLSDASELARSIPFVADGGSCNRDSVRLYLPRANRGKMNGLAHRTRLSIFAIKSNGVNLFLIRPPGPGQAAHPSKQAEAMAAHLSAAGWNASMWWQAD